MFLLGLFICSSYASITLTNAQKYYSSFVIEQLHDTEDNLSIHDVSKMQFSQKIQNRFAKGYVKGAFWFKFNINNISNKNKYILHFNEVLFEQFDFYTHENNNWKKISNGFAMPLEKRDMKNMLPTFIVNIAPNESKDVYIHAKSEFSNLGEFSIYEYETFFIRNNHTLKVYLFYFGVLSMLIVLNLFLYYRFKQSIYIYYVAYTTFFMLFVLLFSGYILYFNIPQWHYELHFAAPMFLFFLLLFSNKFLNIQYLLPHAYKLLKFLALLMFLLAILIVFQTDPWYQVMNVFATCVFILLIYTAVATMRQGNKSSVYYLLAMSVYMFTIFFMSSMANGWIEYNYFNRYAYLYGSCFEIVFFALMLVNRFYDEQNERLLIQNELLSVKNKNEAYLQQEVQSRTEKIQTMNERLHAMVQDKELLLKELYHRVKNNFQMVISLLWIELGTIENSADKNNLSNTISRIKSMSLMHDYLYNSSTLHQIRSDEYIMNIIDNVKKIYSNNHVSIRASLFNCDMSINNAMNLGMIINEVLNNAIKHYEGTSKCIITINFKKYDNKYLLSIQDNGKGFDTSIEHEGLGMGIIEQFVNKMQEGSHMFVNNHGSRFELAFKA